MFDQVMKRSNWIWIYKMGRFAEERRAFLSDLNEQGHSMQTLRNVNRFLLGIAERVNVRRSTEITEVQIVRAARDWVAKSCALDSRAETHESATKRFVYIAKNWLRFLGKWHDPVRNPKFRAELDRLAIDDISPNVVSHFLAHLEQSRSCSVATRNQRLATLHAFARFTGESSPEHVDWCAQIRQIPFKRGWRKPVPYLEKDEIDELLGAPDCTTEHGKRDHALLLFLYNSGARATEDARVTIEDLAWDATGTGSVKIRGKGRKVRFCPLWKRTMAELRPLIRGRDAPNPLFLNRYGDPMTRFGIHTLVARHAESAAIKVPSLKTKRLSPHTIRHAWAYYTTFQSSLILKAIGLVRAEFVEVDGHHGGQLLSLAVPEATSGPFCR